MTLRAKIFTTCLAAASVGSVRISAANPPDPSYCTDPEYGELAMDEIVRLLIPNYEVNLEEWRNGGVLGEKVEFAGARVSEAIQTDFGAPGYHFVLASYDAATGSCDQCVISGLGVIDTDARKLVCSIGGEDDADRGGIAIEDLKVTHVSTSDRFDGFSFEWQLGGRFHSTEIRERRIYRPGPAFPEKADFQTVWSGLLQIECGISCFGIPQRLCASMTHDDKSNEWTYRSTSLYGRRPLSWYQKNGSQGSDDDENCENVNYPIEFRTEERWRFDTNGDFIQTFLTEDRLDKGETTSFPFQLRRRLSEKGPGRIIASKHPTAYDVAHDYWGVLSPSERLLLTGGRYKKTLELKLRGTKALVRSIDLGEDAPTPEIEEVGWSPDEKRFYLTVRFGFEERRALLSFSTTKADDWWERSLPASSTQSTLMTGRVRRRSVKRPTGH